MQKSVTVLFADMHAVMHGCYMAAKRSGLLVSFWCFA